MLRIMRKEIDVEKSELLYDKPFTEETLASDWDITGGEWWMEDGWLTGKNPGNCGGIIYSKKAFTGNILMEFDGRTVPPCKNDLNFTWNTEGWDYEKNDAGIGYIAGLQGWWENKAGIEKYPECKVSAQTPLFDFEAGRTYHFHAGSIDGHCFIFVDGKLVIELLDPEPIDSKKYSKIGLGTYASYCQFRNLKVRRIKWKPVEMSYTPDFK